MSVIGTDILQAAALLRDGAVVGIPTETVYGLAANAFDPAAVLRVFEVKGRPSFDPLIVHVADPSHVASLVRTLPESAETLMAKCWPGPLTLVLPKLPQVPDIVTSGLDAVAVRMPSHPMARTLLSMLEFPLAAPSANPFGYVSPTTAQHVADQLGAKIPYILDGGPCEVGVESTILGYQIESGSDWTLLRAGGVPLETLEGIVGPIAIARPTSRPSAPGMLDSHYAPRTPLLLGDIPTLLTAHQGRRVAVLAFRTEYPEAPTTVLAPDGDLRTAARTLFGALRTLDASDAEVIIAERVPNEGLGRAINDRLARAATHGPSER